MRPGRYSSTGECTPVIRAPRHGSRVVSCRDSAPARSAMSAALGACLADTVVAHGRRRCRRAPGGGLRRGGRRHRAMPRRVCSYGRDTLLAERASSFAQAPGQCRLISSEGKVLLPLCELIGVGDCGGRGRALHVHAAWEPVVPVVAQSASPPHLIQHGTEVMEAKSMPDATAACLSLSESNSGSDGVLRSEGMDVKISRHASLSAGSGDNCDGPGAAPQDRQWAGPPKNTDHERSLCRQAWSALGLLGESVVSCSSRMSEMHRSLLAPIAGAKRNRDVFPLQLVDEQFVGNHSLIAHRDIGDAVRYVNGLIVVLNCMYGVKPPLRVDRLGCHGGAQLQAVKSILKACAALHDRLLSGGCPATGAATWAHFERDPRARSLKLVAELVDIPDCAGTCDPLKVLSKEVVEMISSADLVFPDPPQGLRRFKGFYAGERHEYIKLVIAHLRCGKVRLAKTCLGGGTVFPVKKTDGIRQREVWHGSRVSAAAAKPPCPRHLASPSAFKGMQLLPGRRLSVTKRDGRCFFDQLALPGYLQPFMGRPSVTRDELVDAGLSEHEFANAIGVAVGGNERLWPLSRVLGMGFSWSSFIAQET